MLATLGISLCPNDIYTYAGLLSGAIAHPLDIKVATLGELNALAMARDLDIVKISAALFPRIEDTYDKTSVGATSAQKGIGPKLVALSPNPEGTKVATPSRYSSASLAVETFFPHLSQTEVPLESIISAVCEGKTSYGIVVNEAMNDLKSLGLHVIADLGQLWLAHYATPLPLGLVAIKRSLGSALKTQFELWVRQSLSWSRANHDQAIDLALLWCLEKNRTLAEAHITAFVGSC